METLSVPFLTRKMLAFEQGAAFSLRVRSMSNNTAPLLVRGLTKEGAFSLNHIPNSNGTFATDTFNIPDIPIMISVTDTAQNYEQGECYITISLLVNGDIVQELVAGFVYIGKSISWPNVNSIEKRPGGGSLQSVGAAIPAAGAEATVTVPVGRVWKIVGATVQLVAAAAAASRRVHLNIAFPAGFTMDFWGNTDQIISETKNYTFASNGVTQSETDNDSIFVNIPSNITLKEGGTISTKTKNINAGDQFGQMFVQVEEFWKSPF